MGSPKDWSEQSTRTFLICCHFLCNSSVGRGCLVFYLFKGVFFLFSLRMDINGRMYDEIRGSDAVTPSWYVRLGHTCRCEQGY